MWAGAISTTVPDMDDAYPVSFSVGYPDRPLDRLSTAFGIFTVIPIGIVLAAIGAWFAILVTDRCPPFRPGA